MYRIPRIFVSHSNAIEDEELALRLVKDLRHILGSDDAVWSRTSGGLQGGDIPRQKTVRELTVRDVFIIILSPTAITSTQVMEELTMAWNQKNSQQGKRIIPLLFRQCAIPEYLEIIQPISFLPTKTYETVCYELLIALSPLVRPAGPTRRRLLQIAGAGAASIAVIGVGGIVWSVFSKPTTHNPQTQSTRSPSSSPSPSQSPSPSPSSSQSPSPSSSPAHGAVLYQADWSQGMAGWRDQGGYLGKPIWTASGSMLLCDGSSISDPGPPNSILAPFQPQTPNYAVEAQIKVTGIDTNVSSNYFGIHVRVPTDSTGYMAGISGLFSLETAVFGIDTSTFLVDNKGPFKGETSYTPGTTWHTYRVEAKDNTITFKIDNTKIFAETDKDSTFLSSGQVGLTCSACQVNVSSFKVMAL